MPKSMLRYGKRRLWDVDTERPKRLKTLSAKVEFSEGNLLLHQFVLNNSPPNISGSGHYIHFILQAFDIPEVVNALNDDGHSALHLAVLKDNLPMVKKLIDSLVNISINYIPPGRGKTHYCKHDCCSENSVLHLAAELGRMAIIEELLDRGSFVNITNRNGETPLCHAAKSGHLDAIKLLVSRGAKVDVRSATATPLGYAAMSGDLKVLEFLVSSGAGVNDLCWGSPLTHAAESGNLKAMEYLISKGADASGQRGWYALQKAVKSGHLNVVEFLCDRHVIFDIKSVGGIRLFLSAVASGNLALVKFLVTEVGADVNSKDKDGETALHVATFNGKLEIVEFLVDNLADVNAKDMYQKTPIQNAVIHKFPQIVKYLINRGSDLHDTDEYGTTPLHRAVYGKNLETLQFLLSRGANLHMRDKVGQTPLHHAGHFGTLETLSFLLDQPGVDLNETDARGWTLLHAAVYRGRVNVVIMLLERGIHVNARDKEGKTALDMAVEEENNELCTLILQNMMFPFAVWGGAPGPS